MGQVSAQAWRAAFEALDVAMGGGGGVNVTFIVGLPFVRTSPDHGTAFDFAGQGVADPGSLKAALAAAV